MMDESTLLLKDQQIYRYTFLVYESTESLRICEISIYYIF